MDKTFRYRKIIDIVYIDFCKAFDSVSHHKLVGKLEFFGLDRKSCVWIRNFLADRSQQVKVNAVISSSRAVTSGVPQGSVLGPTLFLLYVNDLLEIRVKSSVYLFADDVKVFNTSSNHDILSLDMDLISEWSRKRQLQVSLPKCSVFYLDSR